jgi:hypothetical protein
VAGRSSASAICVCAHPAATDSNADPITATLSRRRTSADAPCAGELAAAAATCLRSPDEDQNLPGGVTVLRVQGASHRDHLFFPDRSPSLGLPETL